MTTNFKLLIAEDDPFNREIAATILEKLGVSFDTAKDGEEAVELAWKNQYDLILMDIQMPVMNGLDASKKIRLFNSSVPIIAFSALPPKEMMDQALENGMNDYMKKSEGFAMLNSVIERYSDVLT